MNNSYTNYILVSLTSPIADSLVRSLESVRQGTVHFLRLVPNQEEGKELDLQILKLAESIGPEAIFFIPTVESNIKLPSPEVFSFLRERMSIPVIQFYSDLAKPFWQDLSKQMTRYADLAISIDGTPFNLSGVKKAKTIVGWTAVPPFYDDKIVKDIDVSLIGTLGSYYPPRAEACKYLSDRGFEVFIGGGKDESYKFSIEEYIHLLCRSKIVLNFSRAGHNILGSDGLPIDHLKGRVFEAISSKALLLESKNKCTPKWFEPGLEYIEFTSLADLLEKVQKFLSNETERTRIAENGYYRYLKNYTAENFWNVVFNQLEGL